MQHMAEWRADWAQLLPLAESLTDLGSAQVTLGIAGVASIWLLLKRAPGRALLIAGIVLSERLLVDGLKPWIGRPRPPLEALPPSLAFPSGHSANSMATFLAVALLACSPMYRRVAVGLALALTFVVGVTRVFLGVHWPSDVIGGWAFGLLAVSVALVAGQRSGVLSLETQHDIVGRHCLAPGEDEPA